MHPRPAPPPLSPEQNFKIHTRRLSICRLSVCPPVANACVLTPANINVSIPTKTVKSYFISSPAPHPLYTIHTTICPQKCTKQNAISRKRNTACLYAACLYVRMPPTGCGLHARPPAAYLPGACLLPVVISIFLVLTL
jgi:hypothetical protein